MSTDAASASVPERRGPLAGLRVIEFNGIGPGPHCAMLLADLGAQVLRIERPGGNGWPNPIADRGRSVLAVDIRVAAGREVCLAAADKADIIVEGFRPGVMERLGLGPDVLLKRNPGLIYGRITGWGQDGPLANAVGHDINYVALTGALAAMGEPGRAAVPPLNLVGDFGGGSMFLILGILAAVIERQRSGKGQVVDAAIVDGVASLMSFFGGLATHNRISLDRGRNVLGGAAHFYRCYRCADGHEIAVGALEPQFYADLLRRIGAADELQHDQNDDQLWEHRSAQLTALFATKTRDDWCALLEGTDACFAPVLTLEESIAHPHTRARGTYVDIDGIPQPAPAPRFSRTPGEIAPALDARTLLQQWGVVL
jgi:alpha-methylacyl-CoA racemase